ncbi:hypothetical protein B0T26DRAFT_360973 [Lasiosphaeria miniovina]|uniref:Mid2 domain-containing protein n=1 Tax=Lasiosphaeria miniovina TaxID=1954250 RepID=A0AA40ACD2_9PEZI|nr:uncharacterized protein B0T26DRAFT_360973 [Lasiosphaeria miniovina]KAK0713294.1 hypothetical protein B0T26DRAFT_360973 [Lasiosphaeria miniovina]
MIMRSTPPAAALVAALVGLGFLVPGVRGADATCFNTFGNQDNNLLPCFSGGTTSGTVGCCQKGDVCLSNGLCLSSERQNLMTQQGCTDKNWGSPCNRPCSPSTGLFSCASQALICTTAANLGPLDLFNTMKDSDVVVLLPCDGSFNGTSVQYCCSAGPSTQSCCKPSSWFKVAAGTVIGTPASATTTGSTTMYGATRPTGSSTSQTSAATTAVSAPTFPAPDERSGPDPVKVGLGVGFGVGLPLLLVLVILGVFLVRKGSTLSDRRRRPSRHDFRHRQMASFGAIDTTLGPPSPTESAWQAWGPVSAATSTWPAPPPPIAGLPPKAEMDGGSVVLRSPTPQKYELPDKEHSR